MKRSEMKGVRVVTLADKDHKENLIRLVREPTKGEIYVEVGSRHNGVEVFTSLRIGQLWELLPRLAQLA